MESKENNILLSTTRRASLLMESVASTINLYHTSLHIDISVKMSSYKRGSSRFHLAPMYPVSAESHKHGGYIWRGDAD